ncbi:N-methylhydantoinase B/oxoprolinase/acetone carboxylase alpha subunit [Nitrobacteraceae bacterium AZCC 2161]|jgi:hypothetical protein
MKAAPPGWSSHQIVSRIDGWIGVEDRIPASVAEMIARAVPPVNDPIADIRARIQARQRMHDRMRALANE